MKKFFAIAMSALLLLGLFAGCGNTAPEATEGTEAAIINPIAAGMVVLNTGAAINISYDSEGLVLDVEGIDDNGTTLAEDYTDYLGKTCSEAICDLIAASNHSGFLVAEDNYIMIKQAIGSALPGANFLETLQKDAEAALGAAGSTAVVVLLSEENLDSDGYINLESAKQLVAAYLAVDSLDTIDGTPTPINGLYNFRVTAGDLTDDLIVDGTSGDVYQGQLEEAQLEEEVTEDIVDTADPTDEVMVETQPQVTEAATEPPAAEPSQPAEENVEVE